MFLDKDCIIINGISMGRYLLQVKYGYNKIWGNDTGRNLAYSMIGTLGGIFPKLELTFRKLSKEELELIAPILDSEQQLLTYYDPVLKRNYQMETYTGDWSTLNKNMFSNIAKAYYDSKGRDIDIIHLNGSIEIAPILKLSDVIVDIVETGTTLRENNLEVIEDVVPISARLIANKTSFKFKTEEIENIVRNLK